MYPRVTFPTELEKGKLLHERLRCNSKDITLLKILLCRAFADDSLAYDDSNVNFVPWGLRQISSNETNRSQMIRHKNFLYNIANIPLIIIDSDNMHSDIITQ